jgi:hypothetical protein
MKYISPSRSLTLCVVLLAACLNITVSACAQPPRVNAMTSTTPLTASFPQLLTVRNEAFALAQKQLISTPEGIASLKDYFDHADAVTAFTARHLYFLATQGKAVEITELNEFLERGVYANKEAANRTAVGWNPSSELSRFLRQSKYTKPHQVNHLLFLLLYTPQMTSRWIAGGLSRYLTSTSAEATEVWIRISLENPDEHTFNHLATYLPTTVEKSRLKRALTHERNWVLKQQTKEKGAVSPQFPAQLEKLLIDLK